MSELLTKLFMFKLLFMMNGIRHSNVLWLLFAVGVLTVFSCKKSDLNHLEPVVERFFRLPGNADPILHRVVENLRSQESKRPFVRDFVKKHGYPRWDVAKLNMIQQANTIVESVDTIIIIPTLLGDEEFVKSLLEIKLNEGAWYRLIDGFNLEEYGYNPVESQEYSNQLVATFIYFEQLLFGEKHYKFTDMDLFNDNSRDVNAEYYYALPRFEVWDITFSWVCGWTVGGELGGGCPPGVDHCLDLIPTYCSETYTVFVSTGEEGGGGSGGGGIGWNPEIPTGGGGGGMYPGSSQSQCDRPFMRVILVDNGSGEPMSPCEGDVVPIIDFLDQELGLNEEQILWIEDNIEVAFSLNNYIRSTTVSEATVICLEHINRMMSDSDYADFVATHTQSTNLFSVWWEDDEWLSPYGGSIFGNWLINYLSQHPDLSFSTINNWFFSTPEYTGGEEEINPDLITYDEPVQQVVLPSLDDFKNNFPKLSSGGAYSEMPAPQVYSLVGGSLYQSYLNNPSSYGNACSIRGSRALLYCGITIPVITFSSNQRTQKGGDLKNYILDAVTFNKFMISKFGDTPHKLEGADANDPEKVTTLLKEKNGIYVIINNNPSESTGAGYSGHVDLILNGNCIGGAYTTPTGGVNSIRVWILE
jgi:hypothetical protein